MTSFAYKAYESSGAIVLGEIAATTRESALQALQRRGQIPFELHEAKPAATMPWWQREVFGSGRLSTQKLAGFTRELASLVKAEIPTDETLRIIAEQPMLPHRLRAITKSALNRVLEGQPLSAALAAQGPSFPPYFISLIKSGEKSGALVDVLQDLTGFLDRAAQTQSRVGSALLYPAVLLIAAIVALIVILTVLVPTMLPIFSDAGVSPPAFIQVLAGISSVLTAHWLPLLAALGAGIAGLIAILQSEAARDVFDKLLLRLPVIKTLIERRETARVSRTLSVLTKNGVPILDALSITEGVVSNRMYAKAIRDAAKEVKEGGTLIAPLARSGLFPDLFLRLTSVGEKTGQLDSMHVRVAGIYEDALERQVETLLSLMTPVLTLVIGACVGGLILSVMSAIFSVNDLALK